MSKSGIAKVVAGAVFLGGITFAGVNYTGGDAIDSITNKATELQGRFNEALADITYLQDEFDVLNSLYADDMEQANGEISSLKDTAVGYRAQIRALQGEIEAGNTDNTTAQEEIQAEVTRLENALTEANTDIANLEAYIAEIEADTQYEPINREAYEAKDLGNSYTADFISLDAYELDQEKANLYADNATAVMDAFTKEGNPISILGVDTYNIDGSDAIVFIVDDASIDTITNVRDFQNVNKVSNNTITILRKLSSGSTYYVNEAKDSIISLNNSGYAQRVN